jgi:hypothetical protein
MKVTHRGAVSLTGTFATARVRLPSLERGTKLIPLLPALDVLGCWPQTGGKLTAYVAGTMPLELRTAVEEGRTSEEEWFGPAPAGIREIDLDLCRYEYLVQEPPRVLPLFPGEASPCEQAA